eukprot:gene24082-7340_t
MGVFKKADLSLKAEAHNASPLRAPNGTCMYVGCNNGGFRVYKSDDAHEWTASWGKGSPYLKNEDPYMWMDARGNWHFLAHRYDYRDGFPPNPNQTEPVLVSGHGYSTNGVDWRFNDEAPYNAWINFHNGTRQYFSTWERPCPGTGLWHS